MTPLEINKKICELKGLEIDGSEWPIKRRNQVVVGRADHPATQEMNWAESIKDAWKLFEEMPFQLIQRIHIPTFNGYICSVADRSIFEPATTAPLAICQAWITWKTLGPNINF